MPVTTGVRAPVALAYAAFVLVGVSAGVGGVLLPAQLSDYGVDKAVIGLTFFTFAAGFMLAGATTGTLVARLGVRTALVVGGGGFVLAGLCAAVRPPLAVLIAVQAVAGYGTGLLESVLNAYLAELPGAATRLNRLHAFFGVGALLGPLLAAWMLTFATWPAVWLVLALACLPLTAGFSALYPVHGGAATAPAADAAVRDSATAGAAQVVRGPGAAALRQYAVVLAAVFLAVYVGLEISVGNWGFSFLVGARAQPELLAGYTLSGYWLGLTVGRFVISPVATRLGLTAVGTTYLCLTGVVAAALLIWLVPVSGAAVAGLALLGFFLGPVFPTTMAVIPQLTGAELVPAAIGIVNGVSVVGGALLPWLAGVVAQTAGLWTLPPLVFLLGLAQLALWRLVQQAAPVPRLVPVTKS